jgi:hypothetical protein
VVLGPSRSSIKDLLDGFLNGTQRVAKATRIADLRELPLWARARINGAEANHQVWTALTTERGWMIAWGTYDQERSYRVHAHVLFIEWCLPPEEHHSGWWRCYPMSPQEWISGHGGPD